MKSIKKTMMGIALLLAMSLSVCANEYYYADGRNHQGYTIIEGQPTGSVQYTMAAAGSICNAARDCKIFVQVIDRSNGNVLWRYQYDLKGEDSRCLKITRSKDGYALTGYVYIGGKQYSYVMTIDRNGNLIWSRIYYEQESAGLDIHQCSDYSGYIVAGFTTEKPTDPGAKRSGYIMKIDPNGNILWTTLYDSYTFGNDYDMAEHTIEVPGSVINGAPTDICYYITGAINYTYQNSVDEKVLSLMLDDNGNIIWQRSFSTGSTSSPLPLKEVGATSIFDEDRKIIYQVSNTDKLRGFITSAIDPSTGAILARRYVNFPDRKPYMSAYHIVQKNGDELTVAGFIFDYDWSGSSTTQNPPFAVDIQKNTLAPGPINVFEVQSAGYNAFFADWLGTPAGIGSPTIHTPDMICTEGNDNIWFANYIKGATGGSTYDLSLMHLQHSTYKGACKPVQYDPKSEEVKNFNIDLKFYEIHYDKEVEFFNKNVDYKMEICKSSFKQGTDVQSVTGGDADFNVYPSPAANVLHIDIHSGTIEKVAVCDIAGRIMTTNLNSNNSVDISTLSTGMYTIKVITSEGQVFVRKFAKE